jgi:hypothetical protein
VALDLHAILNREELKMEEQQRLDDVFEAFNTEEEVEQEQQGQQQQPEEELEEQQGQQQQGKQLQEVKIILFIHY